MAQTSLCWTPFERSKLNLDQINTNIIKACQTAGRNPNTVSLLAVSKNKPESALEPLLVGGHRLFGENRVQEATHKWMQLHTLYPDIELHLIGSLQTNKVKEALEIFDVIETIDRPRLVIALAKEWSNTNRRTNKVFIQINTGREPQKGGVLPEDLKDLIDLCHQYNLPLTGLMCIPPAQEDSSSHFGLLGTLAKEYSLAELSMGMSADYEKAIAYGATIVRVGTALWK